MISAAKKVLKNYPWDQLSSVKNPCCIFEGDARWENAYANWLVEENPTSDLAWKEGVFFTYSKGQAL